MYGSTPGSPAKICTNHERAALGQDYGKAIADCNQALRLQPDDGYARDNLGIIYLKQGDYAKAIGEFDLSLKRDARRARALYGRGLAKTRSGDAKTGAADIEAGRAVQPGIVDEFAGYGVR